MQLKGKFYLIARKLKLMHKILILRIFCELVKSTDLKEKMSHSADIFLPIILIMQQEFMSRYN